MKEKKSLPIKAIRPSRFFAETLKRKLVEDIERNLCTIAEVSREHEVSVSAIYKWIYKYSRHLKRGVRQIIEPMSDTKKIISLKDRIKDLEQIIGQKQIIIEFQSKMIELAEEEYDVDIKKKYGSKPSSGSGKIGKNT
jgi:transposase